jgi:GNAT superfamily N-acetyltransferase
MEAHPITSPQKRHSSSVGIRPIRRSDIEVLVELHQRFETYLKELDPKRKIEAPVAYESRLQRDGFGGNRAFQGYLAILAGQPVGYLFYHHGYDPDEMQGRVAYVIDLYVDPAARRHGVGRLLMEEVARNCGRKKGIDIYFCVWDRNKTAIAFYKKLRAQHNSQIMLFHWTRECWRTETKRRASG